MRHNVQKFEVFNMVFFCTRTAIAYILVKTN